jgi:hypothetical protein
MAEATFLLNKKAERSSLEILFASSRVVYRGSCAGLQRFASLLQNIVV